ncbi:non-ribosomal peptide synthetase [Mycobacterium talmoniae]|uniref:Phenyloxazoline synthase MbtB n=1 Tax=Mycobacterium talmoniae TaxID=1858794 RepID=A0A1S1NE22_9MYCO|nr:MULTISPECIES: non-ribosomal peptide synthetase [Mycobacterium]OHU98270.1 non-ribosomal peptide synthetase [Mycobacterium talmoniae]TDH51132.1 non-ribosomal peptide synthetase [Mycobacterium eburneum]
MAGAGLSEADIRAAVADLLGVTAAAVDPGADLIGQGLDSIRMMALAGRWRKQGIDIDFAALAAEPRIDAWSTLLAAATAADLPQPAATDADAADAPFPLAPMQHAMWVGRQDNQPLGGVAGHLYVEFDGGEIDPQRLATAATALATRHPMLRVQFTPDGTQRIGPATDFPVTVHDLRDQDPAVVETRLADIRDAKSHQQLDGQVLELTLSRLPGSRSRLHVDLDMQAADAMSYRTLMADLAALYRGTTLPALGYTYRDYRQAMLRRDAEPAPARDADRDWWATRLPDLPDPPRLASHPEQCESRTSSRRWHWLDPHTRDALFAKARARGITPAMTLAAAFANTLARWSAGPRFLLNVPLFGREPLHPDVDRLVGDFTSSLLLDIDLTDTATATARAHTVQNTMRTAAAHAAYSGLSVLRDLGRHRGTQVLAPVVFTSALGLGELFAGEVTDTFGAPSWIISQGPQVLLDAQVTEFDGGVLVNWDVRDDAFLPGVVDAMFAHHIDELTRLAGDDTAWDAPAPAALPAAQRAVRAAVNAGTAEPSGETLYDGFFRRAEQQPDAPAVYASTGELSYRQLRDQALAVAAALRDLGIRDGDTVAVLGPKHADQIPALLGILAAGGVYLPIGVDQPADRVTRILDTGAVRAVLACGTHPVTAPGVPVLTVTDAVAAGAGSQTRPAATDPAQLAYVLFTSGSTGEPKGVEMTHDAAMNTVEFLSRHFEIGPADRCLALATLESDLSVLDIFAILRAGGAIVMVDEAHRRDPDRWAALIDTHRVTVLNFMPGWLHMLLEVGAGRLSSLRVVPVGGDWVRPELARRLRTEAPRVRFAGLGGATETAVHATLCEVADPPAHWTAVPYGTPFPNIACRVVNAAGDDCPDWVPGELWVSGRGIARGYRGRPDLTAQKFVEYDGRTWYRTGDLVRYWPDGTCEFVGRADHRVKVSGYRIELGDVEAALRRVTGVVGAVAAVVPTGPDSAVLAAMVRVDDDRCTAAQIRAGLADFVPAHMIPQQVTLVDRIPFTVGGKIDRRAVTADLTAAVAAGGAPGYRAPSTPVEKALAAIVGELLGVPDVGVDDDFFALGGDSVLATAAVARIRTWLDVPDAAVADLFATRTVAALAGRLADREPDPGRLDQVAEVYLDIAGMDSAAVLSEIGAQ